MHIFVNNYPQILRKRHFYRTHAGAEIDLILEFRTGETWAIEIKRGLSLSVSKGFYNGVEDLSPNKSYVVYGGDDQFKINDGVEMISLRLLMELLLSGSN